MDMDLEIDHYSVSDLEQFFKLPKQKYTAADVEEKEYDIRETLLSSGHINKKFKRDLIFFLEKAKERILAAKFPLDKSYSTIQKNMILDTSDIPKSEVLPTSRMQNIIERPITQYMHSQPSEYFQGVINPLNTRTIVKNITVDTRFRKNFYSTSSSNFLIQLPTKISKVVSMQMTAIELPRDFYGISASYGNNYFVMQIFQKINGVGYEADRILIIPDGNYTAEGLINKINELLCPLFDGIMTEPDDIFSYVIFELNNDASGSGNNRVIVKPNPLYPSISGNIEEIVLNFGTDIVGNNDTVYLTNKIGWNLGFINPLYKGKTIYVSEKAIEPNAIKYIYLAVDDFNKSVNDVFISAFEKNGLKPNILARISMYGNSYNDVITNNEYKVITEPRKYFGPVDIQRLQIKLFDDHGRILDMNHSDFSFCLNLTLMYDL
jgi:hypothetical protein